VLGVETNKRKKIAKEMAARQAVNLLNNDTTLVNMFVDQYYEKRGMKL